MEYYMFVHFGPNTFTDVEWGDGKEDPRVFRPTDLDCRQWAETARNAGMKGIIITAKHHDGFCLWPSQFSTHTVRESGWKEGKGDVLKELSDACKAYGLKFGVYLSPWDRNHPAYGTPGYNQVFAGTLKEVYTRYGGEGIFEQWFDGACGEGPNGRKQEYDWDLFHRTVFSFNPDAIIFSDIGPGCRWMGNERGVAGETNWSALDTAGFTPGLGAPAPDVLNSGNRGGQAWVPAETDVSIRPGWFYSPATDDRVKTLEQLTGIYYTSIGRNSNLLLNVPPDRRGRIHPNDSARLMEFRDHIAVSFQTDLAQGAEASASSVRGGSSRYRAGNVLHSGYDTYWATDDGEQTAWIELLFPSEQTFNRLLLQEYIPLGQRVARFTVEVRGAGENWEKLTEATTIGYKRILRFPAVTASGVRVRIEEALASPVLNRIAVYRAPEQLSAPVISRNREGTVRISCATPDPVIYYTLDGSRPTSASRRYAASFPLPEGGKVTAVAILSGGLTGEPVTADFDIAPAKWSVPASAPKNASLAIDGNPSTVAYLPAGAPLIISLGESRCLSGFTYIPQMNTQAPHVVTCTFSVSTDGKRWVPVKKQIVFNNIRNNPVRQDVRFDKAADASYIKLEATETAGNGSVYAVAELSVITCR
jgi:alpha-L-fucosidase